MSKFTCKSFQELSLEELYAIMQLRQEVFVVEQNCPYLDADDKDQEAWHLMGWNKDKKLIAYTRLLPKGIAYKDYVAIGRVVTSQSVRGSGAGKDLMQETIDQANVLFEYPKIKISAQSYLIRFYESYGFESFGEEYLEDNIPHIAMIRPKKTI